VRAAVPRVAVQLAAAHDAAVRDAVLQRAASAPVRAVAADTKRNAAPPLSRFR